MQVRDGEWSVAGSRLEPQPMQQAKDNAFALRRTLRALGGDLGHVTVEYGVALPNTVAIDGVLPTDTAAVQILTAPSLDEPQDAIESLATARWGQALTAAGVATIVATLRPDAGFHWDPDARARAARERLDELCANQVAALETLDANRRAYVAGRAGTGKTRLAIG